MITDSNHGGGTHLGSGVGVFLSTNESSGNAQLQNTGEAWKVYE